MSELTEDRVRIIVNEEMEEMVRRETCLINHTNLKINFKLMQENIKMVDRKLWAILTLLLMVLIGVFVKSI